MSEKLIKSISGCLSRPLAESLGILARITDIISPGESGGVAIAG